MNPSFDNWLKGQMKSSFEEHEPEYNAQHWDMLKERLHPNKRRNILGWIDLSRAAAIVTPIVFGAAVAWLAFQSSPTNRQQSIASKDQQETINSSEQIIPSRDELLSDTEENTVLAQKQQLNTHNQKVIIYKEEESKEEPVINFAEEGNTIVLHFEAINNTKDTTIIDGNQNTLFEEDTIKSNSIADNNHNTKNLEWYSINNQIDTINKNVEFPLAVIDREKDLFIEKPKEESKNPFDSRSNPSKINIGVLVTPYSNHSITSSISPNINMGGGVMTEIPIIDNLELYTGLIISGQSWDIVEGDGLDLFSSSSDESPSSNNSSSSSLPLSVNLVGIDIPINLKYNFKVNEKRNVYLVTGISNFSYLKEEFQTGGSYSGSQSVSVAGQTPSTVDATAMSDPSDPTGPSVPAIPNTDVAFQPPNTEETGSGNEEIVISSDAKVESISKKGAFETLDLAKMMNISIGFDYKLSDSHTFTVEPYYKLPLGTLTDEKLRFALGGVIMKFNFGVARKATIDDP